MAITNIIAEIIVMVSFSVTLKLKPFKHGMVQHQCTMQNITNFL